MNEQNLFKIQEVMSKTVPLVSSIWRLSIMHSSIEELESNPTFKSIARELDSFLYDCLSARFSMSDSELLGVLRSTFSVRYALPTWQPLSNAAYEQFVTIHGRPKSDRLMSGLIPKDSDIMVKSIGNQPHGSTDSSNV